MKESELASVLQEIITEEVAKAIDEGLIGKAWNLAKNTAAFGAKTVLSPFTAAGDVFKKAVDISTGDFSAGGGSSSSGRRSSNNSGTGRKSRKQTRAERQRSRLADTRGISYEYGRPETIPGWGRRARLAPKTQITPPNTNNGIDWGEFGNHYHDEGDRAWNRKFTDIENSFIRNGRRHQNRYKRILVDWLKNRDRAYKTYIQEQN